MLFQATHSWDRPITSMKRLRIPSVGDFVYRSWSLETLKHLKAKPSSTIEEVLQPVQIHRREPRVKCYLQLRPIFVEASHQTLVMQPRLILPNPVKLLFDGKASLSGEFDTGTQKPNNSYSHVARLSSTLHLQRFQSTHCLDVFWPLQHGTGESAKRVASLGTQADAKSVPGRIMLVFVLDLLVFKNIL